MVIRTHHLQVVIKLNASLAAALCISGCAIVTSRAPDADTPPSGMLYYLPKAVLPIELVAKGGALELRVQPSKLVADPGQRYLLKHPTNILASDNVKVDWDSSGMLLSKIAVDSTDQTLNILKEVAKATALGRAEAAAAAGEVILASGDFDPDVDAYAGSNAAVMSDLHAALYRQLRQWAAQCARRDLKEEEKPDPVNCAMAGQLLPRLANREQILRITAEPMGTKAASATDQADCSVGLCYRGQQPFILGLEVSDFFSRRTTLMLPNQSPAIALPLNRAPFVKTEHTVEFQTNGTLKSVDTKRPSSALAVVSWPLDVYKAVLNVTAELITLRIGAKDNEVKLAQKELDTAKELKRLADEMDAFNKGKNKTEGAGEGGSRSYLLSIPLGRTQGSSKSLLPTDKPEPGSQTPKDNCKAGESCPGAAGAAGGK